MTEIFPMPPIAPELHDRSLPMDTIGRPSRWVDYGVVDEHDRLLAPNEVGELVFRPCIPHAMVSEYYKDPERTMEAFRNLMFHTGDLACYDDDGILHFRSRKQDRIRRRGENVSAAELEWVVMKHECRAGRRGVRGPEPARRGGRQARRRAARALPLEDLHAWLTENLPRFMVPAVPRGAGELPEDPERADREVQADRGSPRPAGGLRRGAPAEARRS